MRVVAGLCTVVGAILGVFAMMRPWPGGGSASDFAITELLGGSAADGGPGFFGSVAFLLLLGVVGAALGLLVRSRALLGLGMIVCLAPTLLWAFANLDSFAIPGLSSGFTCALLASAGFLVATVTVSRR